MDKRDLQYEQYVRNRIALRETNEKAEALREEIHSLLDEYRLLLTSAGELTREVKAYEAVHFQ